MSWINNKTVTRIGLMIGFVLINALLIVGISKVLGFLNTGADRGSLLKMDKESLDTYMPKVEWVNKSFEGTTIQTAILKDIQRHYLFAWHMRNNAFLYNKEKIIDDFYTDSVRATLKKNIGFNKAQKIFIESSTLEHHIDVHFFSYDGKIINFTDYNVAEIQNIYRDNKYIGTVLDTASYEVVLLQEAEFWRVRHILRKPVNKNLYARDTFQKPIQKYTVVNKKMYKNQVPFFIQGINYYPQNAPWDLFGEKFDLATLEKDFNIIRKAGLNTIRIFLQYKDFGERSIDPEKLEKLDKLLAVANAFDLAVVVTLFDFYGDYTLETLTQTQRHAEQIVSYFKNNPAILAWDIKNEPDLDFESRQAYNVINWLTQIIGILRKYDDSHLITIGWSRPAAAKHLEDKVDFLSYHYYFSLAELPAAHKELENYTQKPVVLQEFGSSSYRGFWNPFGADEEAQAAYHKTFQEILTTYQIPYLSWTLYDFEEVPVSVVGKLPWRRSRQKKFGFIDKNGNPKPAFRYISKP